MWRQGHGRSRSASALLLAAAGALWLVSIGRAGAEPFRAALWVAPGQAQYWTLLPDGSRAPWTPHGPPRTPLGSLWKLFVSAYLIEQNLHPAPYTCTGLNPEDAQCCRSGGSVEMEAALARSCGPFFSPRRLGIFKSDWSAFWQAHPARWPVWLVDLNRLRPDAVVPVPELLDALADLRLHLSQFAQLETTLLRVTVDGTAEGLARHIGGALQVKTYTWSAPEHPGTLIGGFAGWLQDGTAIWIQGQGPSRDVVAAVPASIAQLAGEHLRDTSTECVQVHFYDRYPVTEVLTGAGEPSPAGPLVGRHRVLLERGTHVDFQSDGAIDLDRSGPRPHLSGRFSINEYVARVLDREAAPTPVETAKAFAILIRTYLVQNAPVIRGCFIIGDTTALQRVSLRPPTPAAQRISQWTHGLILSGADRVQYRLDDSVAGPPGRRILAWNDARLMGESGLAFDEILHRGFPGSGLRVLSLFGVASACEPLPAARLWLSEHLMAWRARLAGVAGYDEPDRLSVCRSPSGYDYADYEQRRVYLKSFAGTDDEVALTHEFLHLAIWAHPSSRDETFVENLARELVFNPGERQ